eukprot:augustus_masked-scaffold_37-processed-gene-2.20-mRNA-1 protein AED:1.00 eAED:1.00 QI:0/0/0/0/1/1/2/0/456
MSLLQRSCLTSTSTEGLECASQREQRLLVVSLNVGGLTTTKLNLLGEKTQQLSILMLQELHVNGNKMLMGKVKVSSSKGKWFFSKPPTGAVAVATYLAEELACNVSTVQSTSDRILKVVLQGTGKKKVSVVNCYAPHCGLGREAYRDFLKELSGLTKNLNKRRILLLGGDFNAQVSRTALKKEGKLGFSRKSNANGKLLEGWLKLKGYSIVNHSHVTGKKGAKKHGTFYSQYDNTKISEIDFFITNKPERIYLFKPRRDISNWIWQKEKFDHVAIMVELRKFQRGNKRWEKTPQRDLSKLLSNGQLAQQLDHGITLELQKLKEEERDYEALTQIVPKLVEELLPEQSKTYARVTKDDKGNKVDTCQRLKLLSDYIASQQLPPIPKIHLTQDERVHYCRPIYEPVPEEHINSNPPLMDEVIACIKQLKKNQATGVDCINNEVLKASPAVHNILLREI